MAKTPRKATSRRRKTYRQQAGATAEQAAAAYAYSRAAIDGHVLTPVIVNPASRFVVVTYWWGRGRLNANMTRPCPDVHVEQIKEEIFEENIEDDPSLKEFNDEYVAMKAKILATPDAELTAEAKKRWIIMKAKFGVYRQRMIDNEKKLTPEQQALPPGHPDRQSKFDRRLAKRKSEPPYTGPNRNLDGTGGIARPPITIDAMIERWKSSMAAAKCNYIAQEYPEFTTDWPRYYQSAINAKPLFIKKALEACGGRTVLYIDGDMLIHQYPKIFDIPGVDFFAQGWVTDPRTNKNFVIRPCFDPYIFETSGGTMAYAHTATALKLLDDWSAAAHTLENFGKAEDRVLSMIFTRQNMVFPVNVVQLPIEYLWLTDKYVNFDFNYPTPEGTKPAADIKNAIIEHPECLTAEEAAKDQGAAEDRSPAGYNKEVTDRAVCTRLGGDFYECIFFSSPGMVDAFGPYLDFMKNATNMNHQKMFNVIPWDETYGEHTVIAAKNILDAKEVQKPLPAENFIVIPLTTPIPEIIYYLHNGKDVYLGEKIEGLGPEIQAAATNTGPRFPKRYVPTISLDLTKPMFFSSKSRVVGCLIRMCKELAGLNVHLSNSYMFISRIRWAMTHVGPNAPVPNAEGVIQLPPQPEGADELEIRAAKLFQAQIEKEEMEKKTAPKEDGAIPKKVHQIWFGGEIPAWRKYLFDLNKTVAEKNGYVYRLWQNADRTPENFVSTIAYQNHALEIGKQTGQSRWAQVADLARMEILYKEGGVYLDSLFETGDDLYGEITRLSLAGKAFIGCNEDPCELECVGANGKKYLSNSFIATVGNYLSTVLERLLKDEELGKIDLDNPALNQTTGPYYLRSGIVDPVADKVFLFKTEEIYPFPMSGSVLRPAEPNHFLLRAADENTIEVSPTGPWLQKGALQLLQSEERPIKPLALYHVGLGGTWTM